MNASVAFSRLFATVIALSCTHVACSDTAEIEPSEAFASTSEPVSTGVLGGWGTIVGQAGLCLGYSPSVVTNSNNPRAYMAVCDGTDAQKWTYNATKKQLINKAINKCLNIENGVSGTSVVLYTCSAGGTWPNEIWSLNTLSSGVTQIQNAGISGTSGKCLNVYNGLRAVGTGTVVWPCQTGGARNDTWFPQPDLYTVTIKFHRVADGDGLSNMGPISTSELSETVARMSGVYRRAGINFNSFVSPTVVADPFINSIYGNAMSGALNMDGMIRNIVNNEPKYINIFLVNTGGGFSGPSPIDSANFQTDYAKMPANIYLHGKSDLFDASRMYAWLVTHELGHYFGLDHTHYDPPQNRQTPYLGLDAQDRIFDAAGNREVAFDGDHIFDTFPDPGPWIFEDRYGENVLGDKYDIGKAWHCCEGSSSIDVSLTRLVTLPNLTTYSSGTFEVDRENTMGYFSCDSSNDPSQISARLTPMQLAKIRTFLNSRSYLERKLSRHRTRSRQISEICSTNPHRTGQQEQNSKG